MTRGEFVVSYGELCRTLLIRRLDRGITSLGPRYVTTDDGSVVPDGIAILSAPPDLTKFQKH
jgi:hypothetical protein